MPFRMILECDSIEEFATLQARVASAFRITAKRADPQSRSVKVFRDSDLPALRTMSTSVDGLATETLAEHLGIATQSLPPIVNGWSRRARAQGLALDDLLIRDRANRDGKPVTIYRLTETGRRLISQQGETQSTPTGD